MYSIVGHNSFLTLKIILTKNFQCLFLFRSICYISVKCSMFWNSSSALFWGFFATAMLQVPFLLAALKGTLNGDCGYGDHWCSAGVRVPARICSPLSLCLTEGLWNTHWCGWELWILGPELSTEMFRWGLWPSYAWDMINIWERQICQHGGSCVSTY